MERTPVQSSQIAAIGYDPESKKMEVEFISFNPSKPNSVYEYENVTQVEFDEFMAAESKGSHFGKTFKADAARWPYRRLEPELPKKAGIKS